MPVGASSIARACSEYGLTQQEVEAIPPARYNSCHGNSYAVWNRAQLAEARKQAAALEDAAKPKASPPDATNNTTNNATLSSPTLATGATPEG